MIVLEGWFLGCHPVKGSLENCEVDGLLTPPLTEAEKNYRIFVQEKLEAYISIWQKLQRVWHVKPNEFSSTRNWKANQEKEMLRMRGSALQGEHLNSFIRMIEASIPQSSLMDIDCDVVIEINRLREIIKIVTNNKK